MSFFGFDTSGHDKARPGFSQGHDPFAGLSGRGDEDDALEFEDTYDGLGDQLDDADDAFNDDTFGGGPSEPTGTGRVGKDFDFFGQTAKVSGAIDEEALRFHRQQPAPRAAPSQQQAYNQQQAYGQQQAYNQASYYASQPLQQNYRPARSGYEKYREAEPMPDLNVDRSIWGMGPAKPAPQAPAPMPQAQPAPQPAAGRKMMSLEEVEAAMRSQQRPSPAQAQQPMPEPIAYGQVPPGYQQPPQPQQPQQQQQQHAQAQAGHGQPVTILQRPQAQQAQPQQPQELHAPVPQQQQQQPTAPVHPTQILQNPNRLSGDASRAGVSGHQSKLSQGSMNQMTLLQAHPQFNTMSEEEKAALLDQETKRAKRNHKIWLLSKDNGVMTPQDKNFITRIQLQQLVSATGNPAEQNTETSIAEDFYYQVYSHIRAGQRQNPSQPLSNFAQTYLFQTGGRHGGRRHGRPAENHFQRMEQQVQRAVEAAKNKPKNPQLVIAGSLGKISFSNAKTPKPLLNIKRNENESPRPASAKKATATGLDRRTILRNVEKVYNTLMKIEDHIRTIPPPLTENADEELIQSHGEWKAALDAYIAKLWDELQINHPVDTVATHPFIAFLSCAKGKKAIPRIFPHLDFEKRTTILTLIIYHLDQLDVVQNAVVSDDTTLNAGTRENIELFISTVMPPLMQYFNDTGLDIVDGVLNLVATQLKVDIIAKTRIGVSMLTLILSRAVLLKQTGAGDAEQWKKWDFTFETLFNKLEPVLPTMFPGNVNTGEDVYVWQLLAAMGVTANHDQQTRLVLAVKDRVLDTVQLSKTLPPAMASERLGSVNLFMRAIGLDVELLQ